MLLSIARMAAFVLDMLVVLGMSALVLLLVLVVGEGAWVQIVAILLLFGYFIFFESRSRGQTPGKQIVGIRLRMADKSRAKFFDSLRRLTLIICLPLALGMIPHLAYVLGLSNDHRQTFLRCFLSTFGICVWPVSILLGKGSRGIHDALAATEVVSRKLGKQDQDRRSSMHFVTLSLLVTTLLSFLLAWPISAVTERFWRGWTEAEREPRRATMGRFIVDPMHLFRSINGIDKFYSPMIQTEFHSWSKGMSSRFSLSEHPENLDQRFDFDKHPPLGVVSYRLRTDIAGLLHSDPQSAIARRIGMATKAPGIILEFDFLVRESVGFLAVEVRKRLIAFWAIQQQGDQQIAVLVIAEPNKALELEWSIQEWP